MKKRIITALTVLAGFAGMQQVNAQTTFGIRAGVNFQNINGEDASGRNLDNKLKTGFNVGVNAEVPVAPDYFVQPGILFSTKGAKTENQGGDLKTSISYVEIPVNFIYKPTLGAGKMLLGFGPYAAFGVGGTLKQGSNESDIEFKSEITPAEAIGSTYYMKRFDAGANFLAGYEFSNKLSFQLNAQLGLLKTNSEVEGINTDAFTKNTGFGVSLGYRF